MNLKIIRIPVGIYAANCYIIYSESTKDGIVVDPGGDADEILKIINEHNLIIKYIILTHGHADHIGGIIELNNILDVPVMIHEGDSDILVDGNKNLSTIMAMGTIETEADVIIKGGEIIEFGDIKAEIIHTPGHTLGGISIKIEDSIITGDTLFAGSIGRTDLFGGDYNTIIESIKNKIMVYPDETRVYPGHGPTSTIGKERMSNPFLR